VLKRHPETYFKWSHAKLAMVSTAPACGCGGRDYRVDRWMNERDTRAMSCDCAGYVHKTGRVFPHRKGSLYCWFRNDGTQRMPGDEDFKDALVERLPAEERSAIFTDERKAA
jgi:hypothetical protein